MLGKSRGTGTAKLCYFPANYVKEIRVHRMPNEETDCQIVKEMQSKGKSIFSTRKKRSLFRFFVRS